MEALLVALLTSTLRGDCRFQPPTLHSTRRRVSLGPFTVLSVKMAVVTDDTTTTTTTQRGAMAVWQVRQTHIDDTTDRRVCPKHHRRCLLLPRQRTSEAADKRDRICMGFACRNFRKVLLSLCKEAVAVVVERNWVPLFPALPPPASESAKKA
jgi:hypothetical protein